ncbi:hypothetical protein ABK905_17765 [Acerihabitans sp. KWT182]|uniref:Uncharacterized protein n=1 Tax=Acerihabitans sp. KWT182 TaxID=3157919 RepID=A0AAU7Q606_9GAMM
MELASKTQNFMPIKNKKLGTVSSRYTLKTQAELYIRLSLKKNDEQL